MLQPVCYQKLEKSQHELSRGSNASIEHADSRYLDISPRMQPISSHVVMKSLAESWPPQGWVDCHVLVALSGGADSVALLRALSSLKESVWGRGQLVAAHFNHRLRGSESDNDQRWVQSLCDGMSVQLIVGEASQPGSLSSEQGAREARYAFLKDAAHRSGARYVATAHTADDQVETVLMRLFRGSGLRGLAGIPFSRPLTPTVSLVRPLLKVRRGQIEAFLSDAGQDYRTDASNFSPNFTRNWLRTEMLPLLRERLPHPVDDALLRLASQAEEWRVGMESLVAMLAGDAIHVSTSPPGIQIDSPRLRQLPAILVQEACRRAWHDIGWAEGGMRHADWQRLAVGVQVGRPEVFELPGSIRVEVTPSAVELTRIGQLAQDDSP